LQAFTKSTPALKMIESSSMMVVNFDNFWKQKKYCQIISI